MEQLFLKLESLLTEIPSDQWEHEINKFIQNQHNNKNNSNNNNNNNNINKQNESITLLKSLSNMSNANNVSLPIIQLIDELDKLNDNNNFSVGIINESKIEQETDIEMDSKAPLKDEIINKLFVYILCTSDFVHACYCILLIYITRFLFFH